MATFIVDTYNESNYVDQAAFITYKGSGTDTWKIGQSFTGVLGYLNSVKFYMFKGGSPTGNAFVNIWAHSGTYGTSSIGAGTTLATSNAFDVSTLTTSPALITFTFPATPLLKLQNGVFYFVSCEYHGGSATDIVKVAKDNTSPTHSGNEAEWTDNSGWSASSGTDAIFYVYADPAATMVFNKLRPRAFAPGLAR